MATKSIADLTAAATLTGAEVVPIVQGTTTVKATTQAIANLKAVPVTSVAGRTGAVILVKGDVGLENVNNTTDTGKPISTATQTALDGKVSTSGGVMLGSLTVFEDIVAVSTSGTNGNIYGAAGTQAMTSGFFYIPSASGQPTGTPGTLTGRAPMYFDSTANRFWIHNGTAWRGVALTLT
jgi:hypothetical protein